MFTGHFAAALAGAGASKRLPLWLLIVAAFCGDLTEAVVAGFYVNDPTRVWSHSLPATITAGLLLGVCWRLAGGSWRESAILVVVSLSHTILDFVTAAKTVWPGARPVGLGLYQYPVLDTAIEVILGLLAWRVWRSALAPSERSTRYAWGMLAAIICAQGVAFLFAIVYGGSYADDGLSKFVR